MALLWRPKIAIGHRLGIGVRIGLTILMAWLSWLGPGPLIRLENTFLDSQFKLRGTRSVGQEVVLVVIDERSLQELGRWPWSRDKQAQLVSEIGMGGAKVVGLDLIYAEAETGEILRDVRKIISTTQSTGTLPVASQQILERMLEVADADRQFANSLRAAHNVVLAFPLIVPETRLAQQDVLQKADPLQVIKKSEFMLVRQASNREALQPYRATAALPPLAPFVDEAVGLGHVYTLPDPDGVTRHEYVALRYGDAYYPSFALEIARSYLGVPRERMSLVLEEGVHFDDVVIPIDQRARMLINYAGPERSFPYVSATDVIHKRVPPEIFKGKAVLVGGTALGTYDQKATPLSANFPGVEKNATVVENIVHRQFLRRSVWWSGPLEISLVLLFGLTLTYALQNLRALPGTVITGTAFLGYLATSEYLFISQGTSIPVITPLLTIALVFIASTISSFIAKEKQAKDVRAMFSSYVSPRIVEELMSSPSKATLGGQRKELTMLFADLTGFTSFSEKRPAEEVVAQLNEYLGAMTDIVFRWNGTLDKFVGDEIVVFWGAPMDQPDHAELAIKCALHMQKRLGELQAKWRAEGKTQLDNGIGINTGVAVVGNIGAEGKKMDYTVIGDQVNLAARFQGLTRRFGCSIVVTESTAERIKGLIEVEDCGDNRGRLGHVRLRKLGAVKVRGREKIVGAYTVEALRLGEASQVEDTTESPAIESAEESSQAA